MYLYSLTFLLVILVAANSTSEEVHYSTDRAKEQDLPKGSMLKTFKTFQKPNDCCPCCPCCPCFLAETCAFINSELDSEQTTEKSRRNKRFYPFNFKWFGGFWPVMPASSDPAIGLRALDGLPAPLRSSSAQVLYSLTADLLANIHSLYLASKIINVTIKAQEAQERANYIQSDIDKIDIDMTIDKIRETINGIQNDIVKLRCSVDKLEKLNNGGIEKDQEKENIKIIESNREEIILKVLELIRFYKNIQKAAYEVKTRKIQT